MGAAVGLPSRSICVVVGCIVLSVSVAAVTDRVIESQSLHVDVVTGATNTSKALLKAIEDGLLK